MSTITISQNYGHEDEFLCLCDNCGETLSSSDLAPIKDCQERLTPGCETPAGECPHCYALAYVVKPTVLANRGAERQGGASAPQIAPCQGEGGVA